MFYIKTKSFSNTPINKKVRLNVEKNTLYLPDGLVN